MIATLPKAWYRPFATEKEWWAAAEAQMGWGPLVEPVSNGLTFVDLFCGAGGSSTGLVAAGFTLRLAANHWARAIETHAKNHPGADHLCCDINVYDMRRLPRAHCLWASPICTEASPAGGKPGKRTKRFDLQLGFDIEEFGHVAQAGFERTRATFHDVVRATELYRYMYVIVENVPDIERWELFDWFCDGMMRLRPGYRMKIVCASSAHLAGAGNFPAPQWRNRTYIVFTRSDMPDPDLDVRPPAFCPVCDTKVRAVQTWKPTAKRVLGQPIGSYREQYTFTCPRAHAVVEPYVMPAASVIDWSDLGVRIADRADHGLRPLAASTLDKVRAGLAMLEERPEPDAALLTINHAGHDGRSVPAAAAPVPTQTARIGHALAMPQAFIATLRKNAKPHTTDRPLAAVTAGGNHHALVIPYRRGNRPTTTDEPLLTMATKDSAAIVQPEPRLEDCQFRMLGWYEQLLTQRFPRDYQMTGNVGERTKQAGAAVSCNAAQWIGTQINHAINGR